MSSDVMDFRERLGGPLRRPFTRPLRGPSLGLPATHGTCFIQTNTTLRTASQAGSS
ncbi:hypothetical protein [Paraburkholderia sp. SG-MS1]|uniref:hypothetical protein n=1 Tax=Paraburkholderia sp. SG-MS1 TaxID=2023741 RepID=UPI001EEC1AE4|nr:hypothetical protein [Paraburkholderia sp. SG-MS1]